MPEPTIKEIRKHILDGKPFSVKTKGVTNPEKIEFVYSGVSGLYYLNMYSIQLIKIEKITGYKLHWRLRVLGQQVTGNIMFKDCSIHETKES